MLLPIEICWIHGWPEGRVEVSQEKQLSEFSTWHENVCHVAPYKPRPVLQCKYVVTLRVLGFPPLL